MFYASYIFRHSKKLKNSPGLLWHDHTRWFAANSLSLINSGDDIPKPSRLGYVPRGTDGACSSYISNATYLSHCSTTNTAMATYVEIQQETSVRTRMKLKSSMAGSVFSRGFSSSQVQGRRSFSTDSDMEGLMASLW